MGRPILGITMGDPASVGPEITVKALAGAEIYQSCKPLVIGDASVLREALRIAGHENLCIHAVGRAEDAVFTPGTIDVYDMKLTDMASLQRGTVSCAAGNAAFRYVEQVVRMALAGEVDATVTNALSKEAINLAGHRYAGHTEIYAALTGTREYAMMLAYRNMRVVHVSTHVSLRQAIDLVTKARVLAVIRMTAQALQEMGPKVPRIAVAGLNPHCGESGLFGEEDTREIVPAVLAAQAEGIAAEGPVPADTVFSKARGGWYDAVVVMYHDQGHIPLKTLGFVYDPKNRQWQAVEGVNITLGLPVIRTSVDHGTAFDQAGKGSASELSLVNAIQYAVQFAKHRAEREASQGEA